MCDATVAVGHCSKIAAKPRIFAFDSPLLFVVVRVSWCTNWCISVIRSTFIRTPTHPVDVVRLVGRRVGWLVVGPVVCSVNNVVGESLEDLLEGRLVLIAPALPARLIPFPPKFVPRFF